MDNVGPRCDTKAEWPHVTSVRPPRGAYRWRGHRSLPDFGEVVVAFIYDYKWMEERGVYYFDAFCQVCGDYVLELPGKDADMFADIHNISCG